MSVPDVGGNNNGKLKEPVVLMVEPYLQNSADESTISGKNEKGYFLKRILEIYCILVQYKYFLLT